MIAAPCPIWCPRGVQDAALGDRRYRRFRARFTLLIDSRERRRCIARRATRLSYRIRLDSTYRREQGGFFQPMTASETHSCSFRSNGVVAGAGASSFAGGRLRGGAISGRARLTRLDLDFVGADESYLCDTGTRRYRASR
jgi:hypothetical protein